MRRIGEVGIGFRGGERVNCKNFVVKMAISKAEGTVETTRDQPIRYRHLDQRP